MFACVGLRKLLSIENDPPIQAVLDAGLVPVFIQLLYHQIQKLQFEAAWCLTNIASCNSEYVSVLIANDIVTHLNNLLSSTRQEVVEQVIWGMGNIAGDSPATRDAVL